MINEELITGAVNYLRRESENAAKARATRSYLEDFTKHLKAKLARSFEGSNANQIMMAEASEDFKAHLDALRIAIEADELYRHKIHAADTVVEVWRSEQATERSLGKVI
jgi:hypothetical protein